MTHDDKKFEAESDVRTLVEAAKIKRDKTRHTAAMKMVNEQRKALSDLSNKDED